MQDEARARQVDAAQLKARWLSDLRLRTAGKEVAGADLPPRDFLLTEKYVSELFAKLQADASGIGGRGEREIVESWISAHGEHEWHYEPGVEGDETDVSRNVLA